MQKPQLVMKDFDLEAERNDERYAESEPAVIFTFLYFFNFQFCYFDNNANLSNGVFNCSEITHGFTLALTGSHFMRVPAELQIQIFRAAYQPLNIFWYQQKYVHSIQKFYTNYTKFVTLFV